MFLQEHFHVEHRFNPWFITGFAQSGAAFTYSRTGNTILVYFAIKLGAADLSILQGVQAFFGDAGRMYEIAPSPKGQGFKSYYYRVSRSQELSRIAAHFDRYPLAGGKADAYSVWREMFLLKLRFRKPDREALERLALRLSALAGRKSVRATDEPIG